MVRKTPQEKKALSYAKDTRNTYGQNDKASRKLVPLRKAQVNRDYRRKVNQVLNEAITITQNSELADSKAKTIKRQDWKKCADKPLGEVVARQLEQRELHTGNGKTARKAATEFLKTIRIEVEQEDDGRWIAEAIDLNGVARYGDTREAAVQSCKSLAEAAFLERLGAVENITISDDFASYRRK